MAKFTILFMQGCANKKNIAKLTKNIKNNIDN